MSANTIEHITVRGFKSIASIDALPLKPVNVLIGPNGSGKSNFISVFAFLHDFQRKQWKNYVAAAGGADKVLHFGSKVTKEVNFDVAFSQGRFARSFRRTASDELYEHEGGVSDGTTRGPARIVDGDEDEKLWDQEQQGLLDSMFTWRIYHFEDTSFSSPMRKTARLDDNQFLREDGANLPAFLYLLREKHRNSYDLIVRTIQRVAPFFDDFQLEPLLRNPDDIKLEWRHKKSDQYFDSTSLSDGTLRFIALTTLFLQPEQFRPSVILVDEPELGLHPYALEVLAALIRQASATSQMIVSTQSSVLIDHFQPEDVLVAELVQGATQLTRLDKARLEKWLEDYSLGQLWEKNEIGGRPVPG